MFGRFVVALTFGQYHYESTQYDTTIGQTTYFIANKKNTMTNSIQRDQKRRILYAKYEIKRLLLKSMIRDFHLSKNIRFQSIQELNKFPRNSSASRIRNRCVQTGRAKSNYRIFKMSRITFRELALKGLLPGVTKSSW